MQVASVSPLWPPQWRPYSQATSASDVDRAMSMSYSAMTPSKGKYFSYPVFLKIKKPCQESPSSYHSQVLAGSASVFFNSGHYGTPPSALSRCPDHLQLIGQTPYMPQFLPEKTVSQSDDHLWNVLSLCVGQAGNARVKKLSSNPKQVRMKLTSWPFNSLVVNSESCIRSAAQ